MSAAKVKVDFTSGNGRGEFGQALNGVGYDIGAYRPWIHDNGRACVTINTGDWETKNGVEVPVKRTMYVEDYLRKARSNPVLNNATMRKQDWQYYDKRLVMATRQRLRAWTDLASSSSIGGFDAFSKLTYEYEAMNDPGEAMTSMDGRASGRNDSPVYALSSVPLPIFHSDFSVGARMDAVSGNSGVRNSTRMLEACGRRVAERVERTVIGTLTGPTYGTVSSGPGAHRASSSVYGYTNFPQRQTKTDLTTPTGNNPMSTVDDVLEMRDMLYDAGFYGPFMLYHSTDWDRYFDDDYGQMHGTDYGFAPNKTLRNRLREIEGIRDVRRLDFLPASTNPFTLILMEMTSDVADAIDGVSIRVQQWNNNGNPWELAFRVWCIQVPVLKYDFYENAGIVHGTVS